MLLRFEVSNHRSIMEPVELSMIAVDDDRPAARSFELLKERVLPVAAIYGPNASGKSNLLDAISWLSDAITSSLRGWDEEVPRDPHMSREGTTSASEFELDVIVEAVRYQYRLEADAEVRYESLHSFPMRRRRMLFEREGSDVQFRDGYEAAGGIRELLTPTTLVLSAAMRLDRANYGRVGRALSGIQVLGLRSSRTRRIPHKLRYGLRHSPFWLFDDPQPRLAGNLAGQPHPTELLRLADPAIEGVEFEVADTDDGRRSTRTIRFVRSLGDEPVALSLEQESAGTQTWFRLIGPALTALEDGGVLLYDEIDASLHPRLSAQLIGLFQDPSTNPHGAQLIFTTHDVSLLNQLNRDEVWLTEKDASGMSQLVALVEYGHERVRKSANLERAYLQGRFGAVPEIDQLSVHRALGLLDSVA